MSPMKYLETSIEHFRIRHATPEDAAHILGFIRELAEYEGLLHEVVATEEALVETLFNRKAAEVLIGEWGGVPVGFALFFHNYSTFLAKPGIYLEDLYIQPAMRDRGLGTAMLSCLARLALERDCGRLEWWCLDNNAPSIAFYRSLGAESMDDWTIYRMTGDTLTRLAESHGGRHAHQARETHSAVTRAV